LVFFPPYWSIEPRKIWQPWFGWLLTLSGERISFAAVIHIPD
jgi:hypothetical protein